LKKIRKQREKERQATKSQFQKSLSQIRESFQRGKDKINDDLQELELVVKEIKK